jgi:hypothetical protein
MNSYVFFYKKDSTCEPIGRVMAMDLHEAREMITQIKQLPENVIDELFEIKKVSSDENNIRRNKS